MSNDSNNFLKFEVKSHARTPVILLPSDVLKLIQFVREVLETHHLHPTTANQERSTHSVN